MFIYVIVCTETLKIYVGQHKKDDLGKYLSQKFYDANRYSGKRSHLYNAMRKHPRESWSIHPIVSGIVDKDELDDLERHYIRVLKVQHPEVGYNICDGGEGHTGPGYWRGKSRDAETNAKISESCKGRTGSRTSFKPGFVPWNAGKLGSQIAWNKGKKMVYKSEESRQWALRGLRPPSKGRRHSEEGKAAMRDAHKNCKCLRHVAARAKAAVV